MALTFWQEPRKRWGLIAAFVVGTVAYNLLRYKHWDWAANLLAFVFVVWLLLSLRSFLPYRYRRIFGENERD